MGADKNIFINARALRENPTHAELIMWAYLKQNALGYKFRRQHPISIYIADFYCHALKLIIELDGAIHTNADVRIQDVERQKNLEAEGITFLRFTNSDVEKSLESVIKEIEDYIKLKQQHKG